jgi:hypothetical protein
LPAQQEEMKTKREEREEKYYNEKEFNWIPQGQDEHNSRQDEEWKSKRKRERGNFLEANVQHINTNVMRFTCRWLVCVCMSELWLHTAPKQKTKERERRERKFFLQKEKFSCGYSHINTKHHLT